MGCRNVYLSHMPYILATQWLQASNFGTTWEELLRNSGSLVPPQTCWIRVFILTRSPGPSQVWEAMLVAPSVHLGFDGFRKGRVFPLTFDCDPRCIHPQSSWLAILVWACGVEVVWLEGISTWPMMVMAMQPTFTELLLCAGHTCQGFNISLDTNFSMKS